MLTDDEIRKAAESAAEQMWPEAGYVGWTDEDAEFHRLFLEACIAKLTAGVAVPESKYAATGDITDMNNFTRDQLLAYGAAQRLAGREQDKADAERYRWLTDDHADAEMRDRAEDIGIRLRWIGKGAADATIDAAMKRGEA